MRILIVLVMLSGLAACSSAVSVDYYQLTTTDSKPAAKPAAPIFIQSVQVANYLNSKSIIMQMSPVQLVLARQHLWAEPIGQQIQRKLANSLEAKSPNYGIALQPSSAAITLAVSVEQFHGTEQGYALFKGRYSLQYPATEQQSFNFNYRLPLQADGYPALVLSLSQAVEQLATDILQQIPVAKPS
jgi:uncharacterized protein